MPWRRDPDDEGGREFFREFEEMERVFEAMMRNLGRRLPGRPGEPIFHGWSVEVGPAGEPRVREFGNLHPHATTPEGAPILTPGVREPYVTTHVDREKREVKVTVELPGVTEDSVQVEARKDGVRVKADGEDRRYETDVDLSASVDPRSATQRFKNGILEITLRMQTESETGPES